MELGGKSKSKIKTMTDFFFIFLPFYCGLLQIFGGKKKHCCKQWDISHAESSSGGRYSPDERLQVFSFYMIVHIFQ